MKEKIKADTVRTKAESLRDMIRQTQGFWQGDAADEYRSFMDAQLQELMVFLEGSHGVSR